MKISHLAGRTLLLLGVMLLTACGSQPPSPEITSSPEVIPSPEVESTPEITAAPEDTSASWVIELFVSGGFAGVRRSIRVSSTGETLLIDEGTNRRVDSTLSQADLVKLSQLLNEIQQFEPGSGAACSDCFQYNLNVLIGDVHSQVALTDEDLFTSELQPLVSELVRLLNEGLPN